MLVASPQQMVPEKSLVGAPGFASVNAAVRLVALRPATPPLAVTVPAVRAASDTVAMLVTGALTTPSWLSVVVTVYEPSSAYVWPSRTKNVVASPPRAMPPFASVAVAVWPSPQLTVAT